MTSECDSSEESGWTKYFEDFFDNHNIDDDDDQKCSMSSFSGVDSYYSTSFVSDSATKKFTDENKKIIACKQLTWTELSYSLKKKF